MHTCMSFCFYISLMWSTSQMRELVDINVPFKFITLILMWKFSLSATEIHLNLQVCAGSRIFRALCQICLAFHHVWKCIPLLTSFFLPTSSYVSEYAYEGEKRCFFFVFFSFWLLSLTRRRVRQRQRAFTHGSSSAGGEC